MAKALKKAQARLESRQARYEESLRKMSESQKRSRRKPGSMNKHKGSALHASKR